MAGRTGKVLVLTVLVLLLNAGRGAWAQLPEFQVTKFEGAPRFHARVNTIRGDRPGLTELRVAVQITYDELQFLQTDTGFQAEYEVSFVVLDKDNNQRDAKILHQKLETITYIETNSRNKYSMVQHAFFLEPAEYKLLISLMDMDSKKQTDRKVAVEVPDYSGDELEMSDLFWANDVSVDTSGLLRSMPNILGNFGNKQEMMFIWFEIYNPENLDSVEVLYEILNYRDKRLRKWAKWQKLLGEKTVHVMQIRRDDLISGKYTLKTRVKNRRDREKKTGFSVNWLGMMDVASDLDNAIQQLKYIATSGEIREIQKAKEGEREEKFLDFWESKDPTPGTEKNELQEEYYRRVSFANAHFGKYTDGWKTDRGMIYIILGPPDDLERYPYNPDTKPYEVWYYARTHYLPLFFVDESGFGEYRLTQESWQRFYQIR
jgi:GWxTD domain-containing protein